MNIHHSDHNANLTQNRQGGFTLIEISIALIILTLMLIAIIAFQVDQARKDKARDVAQTYIWLNGAMESYLNQNYENLLLLPPECSVPRVVAPGSSGFTPPVAPTSCQLSIPNNANNIIVQNGLQPTFQNLTDLGLIDGINVGVASNGRLPLPVITTERPASVQGGNWLTVDASTNTQIAPNFNFLVQLVCAGTAQTITNSATPCPNNRLDLRGLVYNPVPYDVSNLGGQVFLGDVSRFGGMDIFYSERRAGTGAGASNPDSGTSASGELIASNLGNQLSLQNPVRFWQSANDSAGAPNILAARSGFQSSNWDLYVRRTGSTPLTSDWAVGTSTITSQGQINANQIDADTITARSINVGGVQDTQGSIFAAISGFIQNNFIVNGLTRLLGGVDIVGNTTITGNLTIPDDTSQVDISSQVSLRGQSNIFEFRLPSQDNLGNACDPNKETLRREVVASANHADGIRLLFCDESTSTWVTPQTDLRDNVNNINCRIDSLGIDTNRLGVDCDPGLIVQCRFDANILANDPNCRQCPHNANIGITSDRCAPACPHNPSFLETDDACIENVCPTNPILDKYSPGCIIGDRCEWNQAISADDSNCRPPIFTQFDDVPWGGCLAAAFSLNTASGRPRHFVSFNGNTCRPDNLITEYTFDHLDWFFSHMKKPDGSRFGTGLESLTHSNRDFIIVARGQGSNDWFNVHLRVPTDGIPENKSSGKHRYNSAGDERGDQVCWERPTSLNVVKSRYSTCLRIENRGHGRFEYGVFNPTLPHHDDFVALANAYPVIDISTNTQELLHLQPPPPFTSNDLPTFLTATKPVFPNPDLQNKDQIVFVYGQRSPNPGQNGGDFLSPVPNAGGAFLNISNRTFGTPGGPSYIARVSLLFEIISIQRRD